MYKSLRYLLRIFILVLRNRLNFKVTGEVVTKDFFKSLTKAYVGIR